MHYVQVVGPYDGGFVGPFADADAAKAFAAREREKREHFNFCPMTEAEMHANIAEFGEYPITTVEEYEV